MPGHLVRASRQNRHAIRLPVELLEKSVLSGIALFRPIRRRQGDGTGQKISSVNRTRRSRSLQPQKPALAPLNALDPIPSFCHG